MKPSRVWPGRSSPLGAIADGGGVNFALFSEHATRVDLCLFDSPDATVESERIPLPETNDQVWHGYLPGLGAGQIYGYRVDGPAGQGHAFNPRKLLLDPYARSIARDFRWTDAVLDPAADTAHCAALGRVGHDVFDWHGDRHPRTPWHESIVYEVHVKGFTKLHPGVPEQLRGTYAGLATPAVIDHLRSLGVTAVELLPVHYHIDEQFLVQRGRVNYWGYNTLGYFAPDPRYAATGIAGAVHEFRSMVRALHAAIRAALHDSIQSLVDAGAIIAWRYQNRDSESPFLVYDRGGEPCSRCGSKLTTTRVAGRTTVMCKRCQH